MIQARSGVKQLIKFCIVGASSSVIDFGLLNLLHFAARLPVAVAATISFLLAVCNGFYWNRRWTFRASDGDPLKQYPKFVATNVIGWLLNLTIMSLALVVAGAMGWLHEIRTPAETIRLIVQGEGKNAFGPLALNTAKVVATVMVTAWNFSAAKLWTFKR
ncbi:MAG: GtrA family protein [Capsulimonadales bacterium]|nr:GtrA family protein [Capsulimonadales bacterium]